MILFRLILCCFAVAFLLIHSVSVQAAPQAAAVVDDGYAGKVLQKILDTGKLKFGQKMTLRLSLDEQGHLLECRSSAGDSTAACAAAKAASPFGTPPYGVPTYVALAFWTGQPPKGQAGSAPRDSGAPEAQVTPEGNNNAYIAKARRDLRNAMYIPEQTKPGTYHATARIKLDSTGRITDSSIIKSSGDKLLDKYCLQGIKRAGHIDAPPAGIGDTLDIQFTLKR